MYHEVNILNGLHFEIPRAKLYLHVLMRYLDLFCILFRRRCQPTQVDDWGPYSSVLTCQGGGGVFLDFARQKYEI